jgi:uncharacterized protein (DUF1330 family)
MGIDTVEVRDEAAFNEYLAAAQPTVLQYGGRYLAFSRDGAVTLEGAPPKGIVIGELPTIERLREWYASPEYAPARKLAPKAMDRRMLYLEGLPQS